MYSLFFSATLTAGLGLIAQPSNKGPVYALSNRDEQIAAFARLLAQNDVCGLPPQFTFWRKGGELACYDATDARGHWFRMVEVTYPVGPGGTRVHRFVFNASGECLLHVPSWIYFTGEGFHDVTDDGNLEVVTTFRNDAEAAYSHRLQIWRIRCEAATLLLDMAFNERVPGGSITPIFTQSGKQHQRRIELIGPQNKLLGRIAWSPEKQAFVVTDLDRQHCRALTTQVTQVPGAPKLCPMCGYGPVRGASCPKCGHRLRESPTTGAQAKPHGDEHEEE